METDEAKHKAEEVKDRFADARRRWPVLDHLIRMVQHYGAVQGNMQAGGITYFAFLSFFPILALAFYVVGKVAEFYPQAQDQLVAAINDVLPGMVSQTGANNTIALSDVQAAAGLALGFGLLGVLYSGLGWISAMREGLMAVFEKPKGEQPNFVIGKLYDLLTLAIIGVTLVLSVGVAGAVRGFSEELLTLVGLGAEAQPLLTVLGIAVGLLANMLLFFAMFKLLGQPDAPAKALWSGALLGAIGFELLKQLSTLLLSSTKQQPAFQAFGIALVLVVWMYYFSRVVLYAASWAHTAPAARAIRDEQADQVRRREAARRQRAAERYRRLVEAEESTGSVSTAAFAAGAVSMLGVVSWLRGRRANR